MATLYWGGGAGTWDATTTTNWYSNFARTVLAGAAPTLSDDVIFDTASNATAYAVTVGTNAVAQDITIAGPMVGNVTITMGATAVINCYGSWTNAATGVAFSTTSGCGINFLAATTGKTLTTNNVSLGAVNFTFNNAAGGWTLGSAFTITGSIIVTAGAFNTSASNYAVTASNISSTNTNVRSISFNGSTLTLSAGSPINFTTTTNLTFNAGTSTINCSSASPTFAGGGLTYYNVSFTSTGSGTTTIAGANTFTTLSQATVASAAIRVVSLAADQTVSGTLTLSNAATANRRMFVRSSVIGTQRTFTVATIAALVDVDFRDIVAAGASSPWSGTRLGNCRNNTNITFSAGVDKYWSTAAGASGNWSGTAWATSSGGTAAADNFPLAQDTCIIDNSGATTGDGLRTGNTITIDTNWNMGTLNFSGRTAAFNWTQGNQDPVMYGNVTLTTAMTMVTTTGSPSWAFAGQGAIQTLNSAGVILRLNQLIVDSPGWGLTLAVNTELDLSPIALPFNNGAFILTAGTLDITNKNLSVVNFTCGAGANTIAFGTTGNITTTLTIAGTVFTGSTTTTFSGTPLVVVNANTAATRTISPGAVTEANSISFRISAGNGILTLTTGSYRDLDFTDGTNPTGYAGALANAIPTIYGNFKASTSGMTKTAGTGTFTFAGAVAGTRTITTASVVFDNPFTFNSTAATPTDVIFQLQDNLIAGPPPAGVASVRTCTLTAGTLNLNNFTLTTGIISSSNTNTRAIAFGTSGKIVLSYSAVTSATVFSFNTSNGFTYTGTSRIELTGAPAPPTIRTISGPITSTGGLETNALNIYIMAGTDTIALGTASRYYGTIDFTGFGGDLAFNVNPQIFGDFVLSAGMAITGGTNPFVFRATSGTKTITTAGQTIPNPINFEGVGGTWAMQDALSMPSQTLTMTDGTLQLKSGTTNTVGSFVTTGTNVKYLQATTPGSQATISDASGTDAVTYLHITDSNATGGAVWDATSTTNTNGGNNTGWLFTTLPTSGFFTFF
jgi:hypothetical protein